MTARYTIDGGRAGKARLDVLASVCAEGTNALLDRVGIHDGARCLDLGCGGGHVARELASRVGERGYVVAVDMDATVVALAQEDTDAAGITNIEFRAGDARDVERQAYDVVYARFLLSHLYDPRAATDVIASALTPGGVAIFEDVDFPGYFCFPPSSAHDYYLRTYRETVRRRGGDPDLGPRLPALLQAAGLRNVRVAVSQACAVAGEAKLIPPLTLERIGSAAVEEGVATANELSTAVHQLYAEAADPSTLMGMPRVIQAWGTRRIR